MSDYLPLNHYPDAIRDISLALSKVRQQLNFAENDLEAREAWIRRYGGVLGSNEKARGDHALELFSSDPEHKTKRVRVDELRNLKAKLEIDEQWRRDQFNVVRLELQERMAFNTIQQRVAEVEDTESAPF